MSTLKPQQLQVHSELDVIALRQAVRQAGRAAGLCPPQQARITAAISEVARALLAGVGDGSFTVGVHAGAGAHPALEVVCSGGPRSYRAATPNLFALPAVADARALVDDAQVEATEEGARLLLRVWLTHG